MHAYVVHERHYRDMNRHDIKMGGGGGAAALAGHVKDNIDTVPAPARWDAEFALAHEAQIAIALPASECKTSPNIIKLFHQEMHVGSNRINCGSQMVSS